MEAHKHKDVHHLIDALSFEIEFWRDLIQSHPPETQHDALERMHQALALAEKRLTKLLPATIESKKN